MWKLNDVNPITFEINPERTQFFTVTFQFINVDTGKIASYTEPNVVGTENFPALAANWLIQFNKIELQETSFDVTTFLADVDKRINPPIPPESSDLQKAQNAYQQAKFTLSQLQELVDAKAIQDTDKKFVDAKQAVTDTAAALAALL